MTPLHETFKVPPAATVEELALTVAAPVVGVGVATGVGVTFGVATGVGVGVAVTTLSTVMEEEIAILVNPLFLFRRSSYNPGVVGKVTDTMPALKAVEPGV